jgi:hypothetical protein
MSRNTHTLAAAAMAIGLVASACSNSPNSATKTSSPATATSPATAMSPATATSPATAAQLQSLIPTPANTQRTDGPKSIPDNGIHLHFLVSGAANDVLNVYKTALQGKGWTVTVVASGGWGATGGATYTGTHGDTYGVFSGGGGRDNVTDVNACAWPSKPANPNCGGGLPG